MSIKDEYRRVRKNYLAKIRYANRVGYIFLEPESLIPKVPKKITRGSINRITKLSDNLYNKTLYVDRSTGETLEGKKVRGKRKNKYAVPDFSSVIVNEFRSQFERSNETAKELINNWVTRTVSEHGIKDTARMLQDAQHEGVLITNINLYDAGSLVTKLNEMARYLPNFHEEADEISNILETQEFTRHETEAL